MKQAIAILKGFLVGAGAAEGFEDIATCAKDVELIIADAKIAITDFKKKDAKDIMAGIKEIAAIVDVIKAAETDCNLKGDWEKITQMSHTLHNFKDFAFHAGKDIMVNHKNIYAEIKGAISDYEAKNWESLGENLGKAVANVLIGKLTLKHQNLYLY